MTRPSAAAAPGKHVIEPRWTSSAKSGVGTAVGARSRVWFTISHGILNEIYYPHVDQANTRDMGFLVASDAGVFSEEKRHTASRIELLGSGVPGYRLTNTCKNGHYRIIKTIIADPERDVVMQHVRFEALRGMRQDYRLYALLAPHLKNQGADNDAWSGDYNGVPMLFAQRDSAALAMACSGNFAATSCGYVGVNDGWQQIRAHGRITDCYSAARAGNVAVTAEIDLERCDGRFVVVVAFGATATAAGHAARAALLQDFDAVCAAFVDEWNAFHRASRVSVSTDSAEMHAFRFGAAMLRTHEDKDHRGGLIASLSIPWGDTKGDHDLGGYHVVWPRDLVESAAALLASGHPDAARQALHYLMITQEADGHWPQNMWLDGTPYWSGNQMDETAFPILLADHLRRRRALGSLRPWPAVRLAAAYLAQYGPVTPEDRWEEDGGYSVFTLAVEVAALLAAADFADAAKEPDVARYLRDTADTWNESIERWAYVTGTALGRAHGVDGYYVRIAPSGVGHAAAPNDEFVSVKNHPAGTSRMRYEDLVSPDALALVRFGLRAANDQRIVNTVKIIDAVLRVETPTGPTWHRYNDDGYGEHSDGAPFDGTGIGRGWPLLAGERGHFELAAGNVEEARRLLGTIRRQTSSGGLIPEQIWEAPDIPARELVDGCPSGSAMPLVWGHAEYVKLARSLAEGRVFDTPPQTTKRYVDARSACRFTSWRFNNKARTMTAGRTLRIETRAAAVIHWTTDGWASVQD
ncbi:MAG TPA: glucan 1,4-alpha-glucosidase, partial [Gemmatimonadaceae bacterium]|nr:glucan 1,4-alpha-glucosidase [Gemmatimonadaceae bacterium]